MAHLGGAGPLGGLEKNKHACKKGKKTAAVDNRETDTIRTIPSETPAARLLAIEANVDSEAEKFTYKYGGLKSTSEARQHAFRSPLRTISGR